MKKIIFKNLIQLIKNLLFEGGRISYSQGGEDLILDTIFLSKNNGIYIDIGANHPVKSSNTYYFYKKGWSGLNIDALPSAIELFKKKRKKDINIEAGISDTEKTLKYYMFEESSYNTFNEDIVDNIKKYTRLLNIKEIETKTLNSLIKDSKIKDKQIDFMTVDVEGYELNVLKSNDWEFMRPKIILLEDFNDGIEIANSDTYKFLIGLGYIYLCKTRTNAFYIDQIFYHKRYAK